MATKKQKKGHMEVGLFASKLKSSLSTKKGKTEMQKAISEAAKLSGHFERARDIDPDKLRKPMTI